MKVIVDASVAVKWYTPEARHRAAKEILDLSDTIVAPDLIVSEVTNAAWVKARRGEIDAAVAELIALWIGSGVPALRPARILNRRALEMAFALSHPVYDCLYLACAELEQAILVSDDQRFLRAVGGSDWNELVVSLADAHSRLRQVRH